MIDSQTAEPDFPTKAIIGLLIDYNLPESTLQLLKWLVDYYPAPLSVHMQLFLHNYLLNLKIPDDLPAADKTAPAVKLPPLTTEQSQVIQKIRDSRAQTILLHGETGSGKTRIYVELIAQVLKQGRSAIVLTPEIGMTTQILKTLSESFPDKTILMHSSLSDKLRRDNWLKIIKNDQPRVIVGPRSAIFSPLSTIGLIVMDEAHEASYKQEQTPYYQTSRVAGKLSEINGARLIFGSATPLISDYYILDSKNLLRLRMTEPAIAGAANNRADINIVKITERSDFTKAAWLSNQLIDSISRSLKDKQQSIVFLNRRGSAQVVLCQKCGWQALCPNCDTSLTYHADSHLVLCHSCSYHQSTPALCPVCSSPDIIFRGAGTKAIAEELKKLFPMATINRFDKDNKKIDSLEQNYHDLLSGKIDIAVGTQIITKGLDLPKLSTVGVVMADSGLYFPDYMAEERTFQNLMQVIGRVARGHLPGRVIIQTYHPDSVSIKSASTKNYQRFYDQQLIERRKYKFPPFVYLLKLSTKKATSKSAEAASGKLAEQISHLKLPVTVNGPAPAFHAKQNGRFVWHIIIKSTNRSHLLKIIGELPSGFSYDIDPASLL